MPRLRRGHTNRDMLNNIHGDNDPETLTHTVLDPAPNLAGTPPHNFM